MTAAPDSSAGYATIDRVRRRCMPFPAPTRSSAATPLSTSTSSAPPCTIGIWSFPSSSSSSWRSWRCSCGRCSAPLLLVATVVLSFAASLGTSALDLPPRLPLRRRRYRFAALCFRLPGGARHRLQHLPDDSRPRGIAARRDAARVPHRAGRDGRGHHVGRSGARRHVRRPGHASADDIRRDRLRGGVRRAARHDRRALGVGHRDQPRPRRRDLVAGPIAPHTHAIAGTVRSIAPRPPRRSPHRGSRESQRDAAPGFHRGPEGRMGSHREAFGPSGARAVPVFEHAKVDRRRRRMRAQIEYVRSASRKACRTVSNENRSLTSTRTC